MGDRNQVVEARAWLPENPDIPMSPVLAVDEGVHSFVLDKLSAADSG